MKDLFFALDPSSTCTGWALMEAGEVYIASGRLLPRLTRVEPEQCAPYYRIDAMCLELRKLLDHYKPHIIVMEWTSGKVGARHKGGGAGLGILGVAIGAIWREAVNWTAYWTNQGRQSAVVGVLENDWTRGQPKGQRIPWVKAMFPRYDPIQDQGGDEADAILLNLWYQRELKLESIRRGTP